MSDLRNHLEKWRDEYRSTGYPGNLAADIARRPAPARRSTLGRIVAAASVVTAIAAAVVLWVSLDPAVAPIAPVPSPAGESMIASIDVSDVGAMPALPDELSLVPEALTISDLAPSMSDLGGMPEMPSMDLNFSFDDNDDATTSEDSV